MAFEQFPGTQEQEPEVKGENLQDILQERNIDLAPSEESKAFSPEDRERVYNLAQEQLKNSRERFRQEENFVTAEQIDEVYNAALEQVASSIESRGRLEALQEKVLSTPQELEAKLAGIERDRLAPSAAQIVKNMERVYKAYENRPRRSANVTERPTVG
ncbi:MAG: hypothetical protein ACOYMZ_00890 [Minisyncoccia bacterium]